MKGENGVHEGNLTLSSSGVGAASFAKYTGLTLSLLNWGFSTSALLTVCTGGFFIVGTVLCVVRGAAAMVAPVKQMPLQMFPPRAVPARNVSRHCQASSRGQNRSG